MLRRRRIPAFLTLALTASLLQLAGSAPARATDPDPYQPLPPWSAAKTTFVPANNHRYFRADGDLGLVAIETPTGLSVANTQTGAIREIVNDQATREPPDDAVVSEDGSTVVIRYASDTTHNTGRTVGVLRGFDPATLAGGTLTTYDQLALTHDVDDISVSADGSRVAIAGQGISMLDTHTGVLTQVVAPPTSGSCAQYVQVFDDFQVALSGDGRTLAAYVGAVCNSTGTNEARAYDVTDPATPTVLWSKTETDKPYPYACVGGVDRRESIAISDDGSKVAVAQNLALSGGRTAGSVGVHDLVTATDHDYFSGTGRVCAIGLSGDGSRLVAQTGDPNHTGYYSYTYDSDWGENVQVTDTTPGATPVLLATRPANAQGDYTGGLGWSTGGISTDGTAVLLSTHGYNYGYYTDLWITRDPASLSLAWPAGAAVTASDVGQTLATLHWPAATGVASTYQVTGGPSAVNVPGDQTSVTLSGLSPGTTYHFAVTAKNAGTSTGPITTDVTTVASAGAGSAGLTTTVTADDTVKLQWDPAAAGVSYEVLRRTAATAMAPVQDLAAGVTQWVDPTTNGSTAYTYRVVAIKSGTPAPHTVDKTVTTDPVAVTALTAVAPQGLGYAIPTTTIPLHVVGQPHRTATASIAVQGVAAPAPVTLTETTPGRYDGSVTLPAGATRLDSAAVTLADQVGSGTGHTASRSNALQLPVGGLLVAHLTTTGFHGTVVTSSAAGGWSVTTPLDLSADATRSIAVPPAADVQVTYVRSSDATLVHGPAGVTVAPGQVLDLASRSLSEAARLHLDDGADARGALVDIAQDGFSHQVRLDSSGQGDLTGLSAGQVTLSLVTTDPGAWQFEPMSPVTTTLQVGDNTRAVGVAPRSTASLSGLVQSPTPGLSLLGATVAVTQPHGTTSVTQLGYADDAGHYTVSGLLSGLPATVTVRHRVLATQDPLAVTPHAGVNSLDVPVVPLDGYFVNPSINFTQPDGSVQNEPLDWRAAVHYRVRLSTASTGQDVGAVFGDDAGPVLVHGLAGQQVQLCADGREGGFDAGCATATLPASPSTVTDLAVNLSAIGRTLVSYSLRTAAGVPDLTRAVQIVTTRGTDAVVTDTSVGDGTFSVPSGTWDVTVVDPATSQVLAARPGSDLSGSTALLGTIPLTAGAAYAGPGNGLAAAQQSVSPGGVLDLTATWTPSQAQPARSLRLSLPSSVSVPDPAVAATVNGAPVTAAMSGDTLVVPVPAVPAGGSGHATVHLDVSAGADAGELVVRGALDDVPLGAVVVDLPAVTLETPARVPSHIVPLTGLTHAGATVTVSADGVVLGTATAAATGSWRTTVTLPAGARHTLLATTSGSSSRPVSVQVDQFAPDFTTVTVSQGSTRSYTREPGASYPFVVVPNLPMTVSTTLADGSRLASIDAVLDGAHYPMTRDGNTWKVTFTPGLAKSDVTFDYVEAALPTDRPLTSLGEPIPSSLQAYFNSLPPAEAKLLSTPTPTAVPDAAGDKATVNVGPVSMTLTTSDASGTSTAGLQQVAAGVWIIDKPTFNVSGDHVSGSATLLMQDPPPTARAAGSRRAPNPATLKKVGVVFNAATTLNDEREAYGTDDKYDKLNDLLDRATGCSQDGFNKEKAALDDMLKAAIASDALAAGLEVAGLLLAPETFGIGTVLLWGSSYALQKVAESEFEDELDKIAKDMDNDPSCPKKKPKTPKNPGGGGGGGGGGGSGGPGQPGTGPGAHPTWIYDPSGTITDGVAPIAGATATLSRADAQAGPFSVWDAAAYEQDNDQVTGANGAYGWNVPEGWYVVTASAPGRTSASSPALQVLPPRTGIDLVLAPDHLPSVTSTTVAGPVVTVTFADWMNTAFLTSSQLTLTDAAGHLVTMTVKPVGARAGTNGSTFAKSVALTVASPKHPTKLTLAVGAGVQDVIGRPMAASVTKAVTVSVAGCSTLLASAAKADAALKAATKVQASAQKSLTSANAALAKAQKKLKHLQQTHATGPQIKAARKAVKAAQAKVKAAKKKAAAASTKLAAAKRAATAADHAAAACH